MRSNELLTPKEVKIVAMLQYTFITTAWISVTREMRTYSAEFTRIGLWQYTGPYLAPYGIPWYLSYKLFNSFGLNVFILSQWTIGFVGVTLLSRHGWRNWLYGILGGVVWFLWIDDMVFFVLAAYGKWYTIIAALFFKLPLGASLTVWAYIFHTSAGGLFYENLARYLVLGGLIVQPLLNAFKQTVQRSTSHQVKT